MAPKKPSPPKPKVSAPLPDNFSNAQARKAVDALMAHAKKLAAEREETELLEKEEYVWLCVNTKHPSTKRKLMPERIQLPHPPLPPPPTTSVALICKDPQREYKDLLAAQNIKFVSRVVGVEKLKGKFKPYEARRQLMKDHEVWLADERVVPMLPGLLGKIFLDAKKVPIPVNLKKKDLKTELARAIESTYYHPSTGTSHSVRIATVSSSSASQTVDNLVAALPSVVGLVQDQWDNVLSVGIKTNTSVFLPIWSSELGSRFDAAAQAADANGDVEMGDKPASAKKGKKRAAPAAEEDDKETAAPEPKKAAKAAPAASAAKENKQPKKGAAGSADKAASSKAGKKSSTVGSGAGGAGKHAKTGAIGNKA